MNPAPDGSMPNSVVMPSPVGNSSSSSIALSGRSGPNPRSGPAQMCPPVSRM